MKQKLLFLALMAVSSQTMQSHYRHGGYWGGGIYFGGPGFGYYPGYAGYYPGYYSYSPFNAIADVAGAAITADAIREASRNSRDQIRDQDPNKQRRQMLAGQIYDAEQKLDSLKEQNESKSSIDAQQKKIERLKKQLHDLRSER